MPERTELGFVTYCLNIHRRAQPTLSDPLNFIEKSHELGAAGVQTFFGVREAAEIKHIRESAERYEMFVEGTLELPRQESDRDRFEKEIATLKACGGGIARTVFMIGRRYEEFSSMEEFRAFQALGRKRLGWAEPLAAKHQVRLAIENHKDHRTGELIAILREFESEWVGVTVDLGNNIALIEDPLEVTAALAPWARSVHIKDQSVREYADGFLLGDAALGEGSLDLPAMVATLRKANPRIHFNLEVITRDPLKVPVFTKKYWATLGDVRGAELAKSWQAVRHKSPDGPFALISKLPVENQVEAERKNIELSVQFAREKLGI